MRRIKGYEAIIIITYIAMAALCVYLNFFSKNQAGDITNLIVNVAMFVIVGLILIFSIGGSLRPVARISGDLGRVTEKIENDAKHTHRFLWEKYSEEKEELFHDNETLKRKLSELWIKVKLHE